METHAGPKEDDAPKLAKTRLMNKVAIVTGGARGIGAATAKLFAENGAHVIVADVLDELGASLAESINGCYVHCDVTKETDVESAVQLALSWRGKLDIMFNNAGISGPDGSITNLKMEIVAAVLAVNVNGMIHGIKHAARAMINSGNGGAIICTTSTAAIMGGLASHAYTLSKAAMLGLSRSAACELGVHRIRVNCVSPHGITTEMLVSAFRRYLGDVGAEEVSGMVADKGGRLLPGTCGKVEDIAEAVLFLASDEGGYITGHNLVVDGGYTAASTQMTHIYQVL